jgi:hypothetical protein
VQFHSDPCWDFRHAKGQQCLIVLYIGREDAQQDLGIYNVTREYNGSKVSFGVICTNVFGIVFKTEVFQHDSKRITAFHVLQTCNTNGEPVRLKEDLNAVKEMVKTYHTIEESA